MILSAPSAPLLPDVVRDTLADFERSVGREARLWARAGGEWLLLHSSSSAVTIVANGPGPASAEVSAGEGAEMHVEVVGAPRAQGPPLARFLAAALDRALRHDSEMRSFSREIAERYEEITLLYSISETLGSVISLEEAARTILGEVISTLGAHRATLWVHEPDAHRLERAAVVGEEGPAGPIPVGDPCSVTAQVFREVRPVILAVGEEHERQHCDSFWSARGAFLSVPVSYTPPEGESRTIGVINVSGREVEEGFSAGDLKLLSAIASQIGAAVENNRLITASLRQERMVRELELAHDLQLKLLPPLEPFSGYARVAARCVPAESVGGDFYHLFRLSGGRLGVTIGDVSSHGFGAALIMALAISAVAIHASEGDPPAEVLKRVHRALIDELTSTEMYLSLFYGVIDPVAGRITFANAGHPYAFRVDQEGRTHRLAATNPPLGIIDLDDYEEGSAAWVGGEDLLFLFTDGLSDALGGGSEAGERALLNEVSRGRDAEPAQLIERVFALAQGDGDVPPDDRTAVLARI
ncbi:MAG: SpoIIE family protein phosphatase [Gemmatimonadota bacterium]|nr:SpoIIE family protein phosphatase [Gemmatimonadota bacterium]